jgi:Ala-tRNA(Pro) deacylase
MSTEISSDTSSARATLFAFLDELGIAHRTVDHPPVFTVEEGRDIKKTMPGGHSKNLFVKDKKGTLTLVTALAQTQVDLKGLGKHIGAKGRLSFGKPELMQEVINITPGSVTPFAVMHDREKRLDHVILDKALFDHDPVWFHPLENNGSTAIRADDLVTFIKACGHEPLVMPLDQFPATTA